MNKISWRFWLVVFLTITLAACASREKKEERRAAKEERAEAKRQAAEERRARRSGQQAADDADAAPAPKPSPKRQAKAAAAAPAAAAATAPAAEASSTIVFVRIAGDKAAASVFDVTDSGPAKLIGITHNKTKLQYSVKPGQYTFMVVGEAADFMQATFEGGKTYYALVTPHMGAWRARFSFKPVRGEEADTKRFSTWEKSARLLKNTSSNLAWAESNSSDIESKRERWWPVWSTKPESQRAAQTLNAEDGR